MIDSTRFKHISLCDTVDKPWGYEVLWAHSNDYVAKIMFIKPNCRMSLQFHTIKEETVYIMRGELKVWESENEEDCTVLPPGYVYHVEPGRVHRFGATEESVMLIEVSTNHLDDIVRIKDDFNR